MGGGGGGGDVVKATQEINFIFFYITSAYFPFMASLNVDTKAKRMGEKSKHYCHLPLHNNWLKPQADPPRAEIPSTLNH